MKFIDNFLKKLGTDRNTFATYILTLASVYIVVDRITELLLMIFTGVSHSYWGPIEYTLALACVALAYAFSPTSKFAKTKAHKVTLFYIYIIALYIVVISMFTQWLNMGMWLLLLSVPNYVEIITEFNNLVTPAFVSISLYLPLATIYPMFKWLYFGVYDSSDQSKSIWDYSGISLADKSKGRGPYTCEAYMCVDVETAKKITFVEESRYQSLLVCGGSGSGKTSMIFEPLIAKDIERKSFFKQVSLELGYTAVKTRLAALKVPYDNDYLNNNFSLNMLSPLPGKETVFKALIKKMILSSSGGQNIYRNVGLSLLAPDYDLISNMINVCNNFNIKYNLVDPLNPNDSIGLNPFIYDNPSKIAMTISSILKTMYSVHIHDVEDAYKEEISIQAIENIAILLKEMYPRMNEGALPNMDDLLKMLSNFDLVEKMCEILSHDERLKEKYSSQILYFKKNFYVSSNNRELTETYLYTATSQLDNLLRTPGIKSILCNRNQNLNFDTTLLNNDITFVCTRRGDIGAVAHKAFGLFYLVALQNSVLRRPGSESSRTPYFLYIDEFADFGCKAIEPIFTMFRKYKVGTTISIQGLTQLNAADKTGSFKTLVLANCASKIFKGNAEYSEIEWWSKEFGTKRDWTFTNSMDFDKMKYDSKVGNVKWAFVDVFKPGKLQTMSLKQGAYKIRGASGKPECGLGSFAFLDSKYKEKQPTKFYDFGKYADNVTTSTEDTENGFRMFKPKTTNFLDEKNEYNPVQTDNSDKNYSFNDSDAVIINKRKKFNNDQ